MKTAYVYVFLQYSMGPHIFLGAPCRISQGIGKAEGSIKPTFSGLAAEILEIENWYSNLKLFGWLVGWLLVWLVACLVV